MALDDFRSRFGKVMMELVCTAALMLTIQLSVAEKVGEASMAIALALVALVYAAAPISGGHLNPAVSFGLFLRGKMSFDEMILYWVFQIGGGVLGALLGGIICGKFATFGRGADYNTLQAFLAELVFTALLIFVVLAVATNSKTEGNAYFGLAIGFIVYAGAATVGQISGGAFNPAIAIGLTLVRHPWRIIYLAWVVLAELLGAITGAALFYITAPDEFQSFGDEAHGLVDQARGKVDEARSLLPGRQTTSDV